MTKNRAARGVGLSLLLLLACRGGRQADTGRDASASHDASGTDAQSIERDADASTAPPLDALPDVQAADVEPSNDSDAPTPAGAAICPSLAGALTDVVVTARVGRDVVHIRRNGERTVAASFDGDPLSRWLVREQGFVLADGSWPLNDGTLNGTYQAIMIDRAGSERWRFSRTLSQSSDRAAEWADERGGATLSFVDYDANTSRAVVLSPEGAASEFDGVPLAPADEQGWLPFSLDPLLRAPAGFIRATTREQVPARVALARSDVPRIVTGGRLVYLGLEAGQALAVIERHDGITRFPLGTVNLAELGATAIDAGVAFTVNGRPRWLALADTETVVEAGPYPDDVAGVLSLQVKADWALVHDGSKPIWIVNLRTGQVRRAPALPDSAYYTIAGEWAFGVPRGGGHVTWRLDLATGASQMLDYTTVAPLRVFDSAMCVGYPSPAPLDDGRLPVALRDDSVAGLFVPDPTLGSWRRIGRAFSKVDGVAGTRVGDAWTVRGFFSTRLSCGTTWQPAPTPGDEPVLGDSVQIVSSGGGPPIVFLHDSKANPPQTLPAPSETIFHPSGKCVFIRGRMYDLPSGQSADLAPADLVVW